MQKCKACGAECRKTQRAMVLPRGQVRGVCKRCAASGLLVVASTVAPVMRQEPLFSTDPLDEVARTVRTWGAMVGQKQPETGDQSGALYDAGRTQAFEAVVQLIQRTKETGTP